MSISPGEVEKVSRKRKHEGESKELTKKKRKQDEAVEVQEDVKSTSGSEKKDKKKSRKERSIEGDAITASIPSNSQLNGDTESISSTRPEKKKRRKRKDVEDGMQQEESVLEGETAVANSGQDEEMQDVPAAEGEEVAIDEETAQYGAEQPASSEQLQSDAQTSFQSIRMSLYLPVPGIGVRKTLSAMTTIHLAPLLLTYFPPAGGVVLSFHDPTLSAKPQPGPSRPLLPPKEDDSPEDEPMSKFGDEFGASWVWLTVTFLVFKPEQGDELQGWTNAMSEGFVGLVSYNYFQTSISQNRIPKKWTWNGPSRQSTKQRKPSRKGRLNDSQETSQETLVDSQEYAHVREDDAIDGIAGSFLDENGSQVPETLKFRVVDLEMIPSGERRKTFALQLEGTLLNEQEEQEVLEDERIKWESRKQKHRGRSRTPGTPMMSGGLPTHSRAGSIISTP